MTFAPYPASIEDQIAIDHTPPFMDLRWNLIKAGVPFTTAMNMEAGTVIGMNAALVRSETPVTLEKLTLCKMGLDHHTGSSWSASNAYWAHSITDPGHAHQIYDPGHTHSINMATGMTHPASAAIGIYSAMTGVTR